MLPADSDDVSAVRFDDVDDDDAMLTPVTSQPPRYIRSESFSHLILLTAILLDCSSAGCQVQLAHKAVRSKPHIFKHGSNLQTVTLQVRMLTVQFDVIARQRARMRDTSVTMNCKALRFVGSFCQDMMCLQKCTQNVKFAAYTRLSAVTTDKIFMI